MKLCDINPHIRFASQISYKSIDNPVKVTDCRLFFIISGHAEIVIENQHYPLHRNTLFYCCSGSNYNINAPEGLTPVCINFDLTQEHNSFLLPFTPTPLSKGPVDIPVFYNEVTDSPFLNTHLYLQDGSCFYHFLKKYSVNFPAAGRSFVKAAAAY